MYWILQILTFTEFTARQSSWFQTFGPRILMLELDIELIARIRSGIIKVAYESPISNASVLWPPLVSPSLLSIGNGLAIIFREGLEKHTNSHTLKCEILRSRNTKLQPFSTLEIFVNMKSRY